MKIIFERYLEAAQLLELQAKPYSPICSAYISYSRGYFSATVNETQKKITFLDNPENRSIVISDMVERVTGIITIMAVFAQIVPMTQELVIRVRIRIFAERRGEDQLN